MNISELLSYKLEFIETLPKELFCKICQKILNNAKCAPCGCQYCAQCIEHYINSGSKKCVGLTDECNIEILDLNTNIYSSIVTNKTIEKLQIKCINGCDFIDKIKSMPDHLRFCQYRLENCPYFDVGCVEYKGINEAIEDHLKTYYVQHSQLMIDAHNKMANDLNYSTKLIKNYEYELESVNQRLNNLVKNVESLVLENTFLKNSLNDYSLKQFDYIWPVKDILSYRRAVDKGMTANIVSDQFPQHIYSYRFELNINFNGLGQHKGTHIFVGFKLVTCDWEDALEWPFPYQINISLVNRNTGENHVTFPFSRLRNVNYANHFDRPLNNFFGDDEFISWKELDRNENQSLVKLNELLIKFTLSKL